MKIKNIMAALCVAVLITSCNSDKKSQQYRFEETEEEGLPFGVTDTINGEVVSDQCAIINHDLEYLLNRVQSVKSPDMLMMLKSDFDHTLDSLTNETNNLSAEEQSVIKELRTSIQTAYADVCREYEIPAEGVIDNLNNCIRRLNQSRSKIEVIRFMEARRGMLNNLDIIHLSVESKSSRVAEVKRLAQQLKTTLEAKKKQFGV